MTTLFAAPAADADAPPSGATQGRDPQTDLRYWRWNADGILFELTQRLPDQTRGFFEARGFDQQIANEIAMSCVFQTNFKNSAPSGDGTVAFDLSKWRAVTDSGRHRLLTREVWHRRWSQRPVTKAARIALEWSLLPTRQRYAPGDYNWGMTSFGLAPGRSFTLEFNWVHDGRTFSRTLTDIECAADIQQPPG